MAFNRDETVVGSLPHRLSKGIPIVELLSIDWKSGGVYETKFQTLLDALNLVGGSEAGDIKREHAYAQYARRLWELGQESAQLIAQGIKWILQEMIKRHIARDTGQFEGINEPVNPPQTLRDVGATPVRLLYESLIEMYRQLDTDAPKGYVQKLTVSLSAPTPSTNVGNGMMFYLAKRGDGRAAEHIRATKIRVMCTQSGFDPGGVHGHELFEFQETEGPDGAHPDWCESTRGRGIRGSLRAADPSAFAFGTNGSRGQLLRNAFENFDSNVPAYWSVKSGTAGTDFREGSTAYFGSKSLEFIAGGATSELAQAFGSNAGTESEWERSAVYGTMLRYRPASLSANGGTLTWRITDSDGNTLTDDQGNQLRFDTVLNLAPAAWNDIASVDVGFVTPKSIPRNAEVRIKVTGLTNVNLFVDSGIVCRATQLYPGGGHIGIISGSTPFTSAGSGRSVGDYWDITGSNDSGGATQPRATWQRALGAICDTEMFDIQLPGTGTNPYWPDSVLGTG